MGSDVKIDGYVEKCFWEKRLCSAKSIWSFISIPQNLEKLILFTFSLPCKVQHAAAAAVEQNVC